MTIKLDRPLLSLDFETTGDDVCKDRIVEIGVSVLHPDMTIHPRGWVQRFDPGIPISPEAVECHGITDEDVKGLRPFGDYAALIHQKMQGKDFVGYNLAQFDLPLLDEEFRRCGLRLEMAGVRVIDAKSIYFKKDPRDLAAAVARFCKRKHEGAHSAGFDAQASLDVLVGQLDEFEDLAAMTLDELATYSRMRDEEPVDLAGKLYRDAEGIKFAFGKNQGKLVKEQTGYITWMLEKGDFPSSTREELIKILDSL